MGESLHETRLAQICEQIDFYFSPENLSRDSFLVGLMDMHFFVPVIFIATFRRVSALSTDVAFIIEALQRSKKVELDSSLSCVRPRNWWQLLKYPTERGFLVSVVERASPDAPIPSPSSHVQEASTPLNVRK